MIKKTHSYHVLWAAGVAEVKFTSVVTLEVNGVVAADWRDEEASGS